MSDLYYTPPSEEQFEELKERACELWTLVGHNPEYIQGKIEIVKSLNNIKDNFMYIVSMFDIINQGKLAKRLSSETRRSIRDRMITGGAPDELIQF